MITLHRAEPTDRAVLDNLMQLYAYDWSELRPLDVGDDGRFIAYPLDPFLVEPGGHAFLLRAESRLVGFALVHEQSRLTGARGVYDMAEFFIVRRHRKKGLGQQAATQLFDRFRGPWEVRQRAANVAATAFWRRVIGAYTGGDFEQIVHDAPTWAGPVQRFSSVK